MKDLPKVDFMNSANDVSPSCSHHGAPVAMQVMKTYGASSTMVPAGSPAKITECTMEIASRLPSLLRSANVQGHTKTGGAKLLSPIEAMDGMSL